MLFNCSSLESLPCKGRKSQRRTWSREKLIIFSIVSKFDQAAVTTHFGPRLKVITATVYMKSSHWVTADLFYFDERLQVIPFDQTRANIALNSIFWRQLYVFVNLTELVRFYGQNSLE